jgi:lipoyl(octanoyl) transferase
MVNSQIPEGAQPDYPADPGRPPSAIRYPLPPSLRWLGRADYEPTWRAMQSFTDTRSAADNDQLWFLEHPPVFTLGMNGKREHVLAPGDIPLVQIDRGGQVTYHGPGQLVIYPLIDLRRLGIGVRELVVALENAVIAFCAERNIAAMGRRDAPGVYVNERKLASIGLRIRRGCSYHGLALNVSMDMEPFGRINPCGYAGLKVTDLAAQGVKTSVQDAAIKLAPHLLRQLGMPEPSVWV